MAGAGGDTRAHVYRCQNSYRIAPTGILRKRYPKDAALFRVPYRAVLGGEVLDLTLVARFPRAQQRGEPLELLADARPGVTGALGELVLLRWCVSRSGVELATATVGQPLGLWTYADGEVVAACLEGTASRSLKTWLARSREGPDSSLRERVSLSAREPHVSRADRPRGRHPQGVRISVLRPAASIYPFGGGRNGGGANDDAKPVPAEPARGEAPYLEGCERMEFGELRAFIDDSLDALAASPTPGHPGARPTSEEEFQDLLGMLRGKIVDPPLASSASPGPAPFRTFRPSEELVLARIERNRMRDALRKAEGENRGVGHEPMSEAKRLLRGLDLAEREVFSLEARERDEHQNALRSYEAARAAHEADSRRRAAAGREREERRRSRARIAENLQGRVGRAFGPGGLAASKRLAWTLLPPGKRTRGEVLAHYETLRRDRPDERYEPERIRRAFSLGPEAWYVGANEFDGYIVFTFARTKNVLLECPRVGNAVYVLGADWKRLSRMSKGELLAGSHVVARVEHRGDWFWKVQGALGLR